MMAGMPALKASFAAAAITGGYRPGEFPAPIASNRGCAASRSSAAPAAITDSLPAAATSGRPNTCADTNRCPAAACAAASLPARPH